MYDVREKVMNVLMLLVAQVQHGYCTQKSDPRIVPNRLQLFRYKSVSFNCEGFDGSTGWRVMRKTKGVISRCPNWEVTNGTSCTIDNAYPIDSGEYWCEAGEGERSNTVNIAVTAGSVILESPVLPVMEGDAVTLNCTTKTPSNLPADFYKDGFLIRTDSTGEMTIHSVSKSDEGLYKCSISGVGGSPESWLAVGALHKETHPCSHHSPNLLLLIKTVLTALMAALLVVMGLLHCGEHGVSAEDSAAYTTKLTYAVDTKHRKERETSENY
uniref:Fc receptor-like protein 5 n=1 Tax=Centroberyx gerrardi TaxID=166262 RepID=UPI003AB0EEBD